MEKQSVPTPSTVLPKTEESILVVQRRMLFERRYWQGLLAEGCVEYQQLVALHGEFYPRSAMEADPTYKQIIPYMVFEYKQSYFLMERKATASEQRLKSKLSLGIGGHIRQEDMAEGSLFDWAHREFHEEVAYGGTLDIETLGVLNDDSDAVGQVHLGFVLLLHGNISDIRINSEHKQGSLVPLDQLVGYADRMESWSKLVLDVLQKRV